MKRFLAIVVVLATATSLTWAGVAMAANVRSGDSPRVMKDEVIDGTLYAAGNKVRVDGTVRGDLMCAAKEVEINGVVEGDVLCAAQLIAIHGEVQGDVRLAGQEISIEGKVVGSATIAAEGITTGRDSSIGRDVTTASRKVTLDGTIGRDAVVTAESFTGSPVAARNVEVTAQLVRLGAATKVSGDFVYTSTDDASIADGAQVLGKTDHKIPTAPQQSSQRPYLGALLVSLASFLVLGGGLYLAVPRFLQATSQAVLKAPLVTFVAGFAGLVVPPFVAGILLLTVVGLPLAIATLLVWLLSLICGLVVTAQVLGGLFMRQVKQPSWHIFIAMLIGLGLLFVAGLIPYAGIFAIMVAVIWGIGAQWYAALARRTVDKKEVKG